MRGDRRSKIGEEIWWDRPNDLFIQRTLDIGSWSHEDNRLELEDYGLGASCPLSCPQMPPFLRGWQIARGHYGRNGHYPRAVATVVIMAAKAPAFNNISLWQRFITLLHALKGQNNIDHRCHPPHVVLRVCICCLVPSGWRSRVLLHRFRRQFFWRFGTYLRLFDAKGTINHLLQTINKLLRLQYDRSRGLGALKRLKSSYGVAYLYPSNATINQKKFTPIDCA